MRERGSVSLVLVAVLGFAAILAAFTADVSRVAAGRAGLQAAADSAALAAAQELVLPSERSPAEVAADYAERGAARLRSCRCDAGGSDVVVEVETDVTLPFLAQTRTLRAAARAVVSVDVALSPAKPRVSSRRPGVPG